MVEGRGKEHASRAKLIWPLANMASCRVAINHCPGFPHPKLSSKSCLTDPSSASSLPQSPGMFRKGKKKSPCALGWQKSHMYPQDRLRSFTPRSGSEILQLKQLMRKWEEVQVGDTRNMPRKSPPLKQTLRLVVARATAQLRPKSLLGADGHV